MKNRKIFYMLLEQGISSSPPGANGLLYLPYLLGERSPRWNVDARAAFIGIGISTSKEDMLRSVLEGVGYNLRSFLNYHNNDRRWCKEHGLETKFYRIYTEKNLNFHNIWRKLHLWGLQSVRVLV